MIHIFKKSNSYLFKLRDLLLAGHVVAAPTETAYGLLAKATDRKAVSQVFKIKDRRLGKPIALVAADIKMVKKYFRLTPFEAKMAKKFWPGPLTLLLQPKIKFSRFITGAGGWVGVRVPADAWLRRLIRLVGEPLTATSANRADGATPYSSATVKKALSPYGLRFLVDGGRLPSRSTSTVLRLVDKKVEVIRVGAISVKQIESIFNYL